MGHQYLLNGRQHQWITGQSPNAFHPSRIFCYYSATPAYQGKRVCHFLKQILHTLQTCVRLLPGLNTLQAYSCILIAKNSLLAFVRKRSSRQLKDVSWRMKGPVLALTKTDQSTWIQKMAFPE